MNADIIAAGLSPYAPETADVTAGRAMIRWIDELVQARADFAIETTLSGSWIEKSIAEWRASGYEVSRRFAERFPLSCD